MIDLKELLMIAIISALTSFAVNSLYKTESSSRSAPASSKPVRPAMESK